MKGHWLAIAAFFAASIAAAAPVPDGARVFVDTCSACHSVGGGDLAGPDLITMAHRPRADVEKAVRRMQDNTGPLADDQISALVDFLLQPDAKSRVAALSNPAPVEEVPLEKKAASADIGRRLFFGEQAFANQGVPCSGCHAVGGRGGSLAADLTTAFQKRGEAALLATAQQPAFPLMKGAYATHPLTRQEAYHLAAFFEKPPQLPAQTHVVRIAGALTLAALGSVALISGMHRRGRSRNNRKSPGGH